MSVSEFLSDGNISMDSARIFGSEVSATSSLAFVDSVPNLQKIGCQESLNQAVAQWVMFSDIVTVLCSYWVLREFRYY
jgi:hypothetical protein